MIRRISSASRFDLLIHALILCTLLFAARVARGAEAEAISPPNTSPRPFILAPAPREHAEDVTQPRHVYHIELGGSLDEFNTPRYQPTYGGSMRLEARFQPNQYLALENLGETDVVSPRIVVNGRRNWFTADDILAGIIRPGMSDEEKALALQAFLGSHEVQTHENNRRPGPSEPDMAGAPSRNAFKERANPVLALNCFYCGGCQFESSNFVILARRAGLTARAIWMSPLGSYANHCVAEVFYGGAWHLFDPDQRVYYRDRDNLTIASYEALHNDPALVTRTDDNGFARAKPGNNYAERYKLYYPPHVMPVDEWLTTMDMTLRPGERFIWRWSHDGKFYCGANTRSKGSVPYNLADGKLIWRPRLAGPAFWRGALAGITVEQQGRGEADACLRPQVTSATAAVIYKIRSPYPIVGGLLGAAVRCRTAEDRCVISVAARDGDWTPVWRSTGGGEQHPLIALDAALEPRQAPLLSEYLVRFELRAQAAPDDVRLSGIYFESDVQLSLAALPSLSVGGNEVVYSDGSPAGRRVRLTHGWAESSATRPPLAPAQPAAPADAATAALEDLTTLRWAPATDPEGEPIAAYHIQVSPRADMLLPISNNFDRLLTSPKTEWSVPPGFLVKGQSYYWRVRAQDAWGAWSPWSPAWKFTVK